MKLKILIKLCFVFKFLVLPLLILFRFPFLFLLFSISAFCFYFLFLFLFFFFYTHGKSWLFSHSLGVRHKLAVREQFSAHDGIWCLPDLTAVWSGWYPHFFAHRPPSQWGLLWPSYLKLRTPALWRFWSFFSCSVFSAKLFSPQSTFIT